MAVKKPPGKPGSGEYNTYMQSLSDEDYIAAKLKEIDKAPDPGAIPRFVTTGFAQPTRTGSAARPGTRTRQSGDFTVVSLVNSVDDDRSLTGK